MARAVKGMPSAPRSPKSLAKREIDRLLREAEKAGNKRNLAILLLLRHTGLRVGELCNLRLSDIRISERKRTVLVRSGKDDKDRIVPSRFVATLPTATMANVTGSALSVPVPRTVRLCASSSNTMDIKWVEWNATPRLP